MYLKLFLSLLIFRRFTGRCLRARRRGKLCSVVIKNIMNCIFLPQWHLLCKIWRRFLFFFVDKVEMCQLNNWKGKCSNYFEMIKLFWNVQIVSLHFTADFLVAVLPIFVQGGSQEWRKIKMNKNLWSKIKNWNRQTNELNNANPTQNERKSSFCLSY